VWIKLEFTKIHVQNGDEKKARVDLGLLILSIFLLKCES
jgi:hypothetical protein